MTKNRRQGRSRVKTVDALDELLVQNRLVGEMLDLWQARTGRLEQRDDVHDRWIRGSAVKMLLQHLAVREAAKQDVTERLRAIGKQGLADRLEADGPSRRQAIIALDNQVGGHQAITLNVPVVDEAVEQLDAILRQEMALEREDILPAALSVLGAPGKRGLPSARSVRMRSDVRPSPTRTWYDRVKPFKALHALYDELRSSPSKAMSPGVDKAREHNPGPTEL